MSDHIMISIMGVSLWFPAKEKGDYKNGQKEYSMAEDDRKVLRVLETHNFIRNNEKLVAAGDEKEAVCEEE